MNDTRPENFETIYEFLEEEEASVMTEGFQRPPPAAQHNNKHNSRSSSRLNKVLRLLVISPSSQAGDKIMCRMRYAYLSNQQEHTALSYAWGDRRDTAMISLSESLPIYPYYAGSPYSAAYLQGPPPPHPFPPYPTASTAIRVTSSLRDALCALRHTDREVEVLVDALSINQSDDDELSSQVQIKDRIYESAAQVAVWLGPSSDNSTLAMDTLREIGADPNWQDPGTRIRTLATSLPRNAISSIVDLFERNYWKRLWIVQEIFYARSAVLYCGKDCIEWKEIRQAMALFKTAEWSRVMNELYPPGSSLARGSRSHYSFAQVLAT
ncbi:Heterokaryon incompatibility protein 6, OR allele [Colletotrichum fructicola Nara gc5]|uniref:Heterokaryon incompatibility protein 6, OR allele n=1 Tax=Colletotrichum fructicola (strain Nara gc5) TaxID=1213859 RepID=A0A7J6JMX3_COLFN|nr:Heterokaryon incompatibility protein 6, OR allele [Colletotrichum fructicola Nara gc5]